MARCNGTFLTKAPFHLALASPTVTVYPMEGLRMAQLCCQLPVPMTTPTVTPGDSFSYTPSSSLTVTLWGQLDQH